MNWLKNFGKEKTMDSLMQIWIDKAEFKVILSIFCQWRDNTKNLSITNDVINC